MGTKVELHVDDFDTVKEFYGALGFRVAREEPVDGGDGYLVLDNGSSLVCFWPGTQAMYKHPYFSRFPFEQKRGFGVEIVITDEKLPETYEKARRLDCVVEELVVRPWGLADFRIEDPFGFYLRFTDPYDETQDPPYVR